MIYGICTRIKFYTNFSYRNICHCNNNYFQRAYYLQKVKNIVLTQINKFQRTTYRTRIKNRNRIVDTIQIILVGLPTLNIINKKIASLLVRLKNISSTSTLNL